MRDFLLDCLTPQDGTNRLSRSVGNQLRTHAAKHPRKAQVSAHFTLSDMILCIYLFFRRCADGHIIASLSFFLIIDYDYLTASSTAHTRRRRRVLAKNELGTMWKDAFMVKSELLCRYWPGRTEEKTECIREDIWSPAKNLNWNLSKINYDYNPFGRNIRFHDVDTRFIISRFLGAVAKLQKVTISFFVTVRPSAWNNSASTGRIFSKL